MKGSNEHGAQSYHRQAFPTVWAPFRGGWVFRTADHAAPPGTVLHFANITLVLPNATYADIYNSGFMDFLDLGERGHVCFTNRCASAAAHTMHAPPRGVWGWLRPRVEVLGWGCWLCLSDGPQCPMVVPVSPESLQFAFDARMLRCCRGHLCLNLLRSPWLCSAVQCTW